MGCRKEAGESGFPAVLAAGLSPSIGPVERQPSPLMGYAVWKEDMRIFMCASAVPSPMPLSLT